MKINALLSGEFFLCKGQIPNGGGIVVLRSIWTTVLIMLFVLLIWNMLKQDINCNIKYSGIAIDIITLAPWIGAVFGGVYIAFYTRFSSQWTYLANLYNQIKQTEVNPLKDLPMLAQWKAGFVEDAIELHLATKPSIAGIIHAWLREEDVRNAFLRHTEDGEKRLTNINNFFKTKN